MNGDVDLEEFQGLLKGDHVFLMDGVTQKAALADATATAAPVAVTTTSQ